MHKTFAMLVFCVQGGDHVVDFFHMTTAANGVFCS